MLLHQNQRLNSIGQQDQKGASLHYNDGDLDQDRASASQCLEESLALRGDEPVSELYIWGNDYYGQLGVGSDKVIHNLPKVCSFNIVVTDVSCGEEHTVFVQGDGGYVYAMGNNSEGRLGTGNTDIRSCNVPTLVDGLCNIRKVSCGSSHSLALSEDGKVYVWGQAFYGALGIPPDERGNLENASSPQLLSSETFEGEMIRDLQAGGRHSIFVTKRSKIYGCGDANQGQLGLGDAIRDRVIEPTQIKGPLQGMQMVQVACGRYHTLFLIDNPRGGDDGETRRELWACGANNCGQIGNNSNQNMFEPVRVDPRVLDDGKLHSSHMQRSHRFSQISAWNASTAVTEEGIMYVWGSGIFGEFKRPRKVKLQNNIKVNSVIVGGSFMVIVDQNNRIVVWGSNSNGEIGVGDSKIRSHPTRLETIEEKTVGAVSVGGSFAFAIGKTTNRLENSIFADEANRSQLSGIQKNGMSNIMDNGFKEADRNNRSINSLEEQLQQIALHSASKKHRRQDSDHKPRQLSQDRSFAGANHSAGPNNRFDQSQNSANPVKPHHQKNQSSMMGTGPVAKTPMFSDDTRKLQLSSNANEDQITYLRQIIDEKERKIGELNEMQRQKHDEYQEKLQRFKEMQDQEQAVTNKLREENKNLREENQKFYNQIESLQRDLKTANEKHRRDESYQTQNQSIPSAPDKHMVEFQPQSHSQQYKPMGPDQNQSSNLYPGSALQSATNNTAQHSSYPTCSPPQTYSYSGLVAGQQHQQQPERTSYSQIQTNQQTQQTQQTQNTTHYQYDGLTYQPRSSIASGSALSPTPQSQQPHFGSMEARPDDRDRPNYNERFQSAYQKAEEQLAMAGRPASQDRAWGESNGSDNGGYARYRGDSEPHQAAGRVSGGGPTEARMPDAGAGSSQIETMYRQRYSDAYPGHIQLQGNTNISVEGETLNRETLNRSRLQDSSGQKEFQRNLTAETPGTGGFMRQALWQRGTNVQQDGSGNNHTRHQSQVEPEGGQVHEHASNWSRRDGSESTSQARLSGGTGLVGLRDTFSTGRRPDNLRSHGSGLGRPSSSDGTGAPGVVGTGAPVILHRKLDSSQHPQSAMARPASSGYYQPSSKFTGRTGVDYGEHRRTDEDERVSYTNHQSASKDLIANNTDLADNQKSKFSHSQFLERSPNKIRSFTPNALTTTSGVNDNVPQTRTSYRPSYERQPAQQPPPQPDQTNDDGFSLQYHRNEDAMANQVKSDYGNTDRMSALIKERPSSAHHREQFYQTQNGNAMTLSLKYDNIMGAGSKNLYSRDSSALQTQHKDTEFKNSPRKPPRQDQARNPADYSSYTSMSYQHNFSASLPTATHTKAEPQQVPESSISTRPPMYKPLDYQSRYSHDPVGHRPTIEGGAYDDQATATDDASMSGKYGGRLSYDHYPSATEQAPMSGGASLQVSSQNYNPMRNSAEEIKPRDAIHQPSSSFGHINYAVSQNQKTEDTSLQHGKRDQTSDQLLPDRGSYSTFGGHQTMNYSQKSRSPFTVQQLNDQQIPSPPSHTYNHADAYQSKLSGQAPQYQPGTAASHFTPQGSERRLGSLTETRSNGGDVGGKEDIKSKLARYKKEREDFEQIRMQFRQKNSELSSSMAKVSTQPNQPGSVVMGENTHINRSHSASRKFTGLGSGDFSGSAPGAKGSTNIFAVDNSGGSGQAKASYNAPGFLASGSPAFGLPEQSLSRDQ